MQRLMRVRLCLFTGWLLWNAALPAQQPAAPASPDVPVFRASTDLVTIDAVVTDRDGKPVTNLTRDDFDVTVAGKHQTLEQAVYIRTQEQPQALAAVRAAAMPRGRNVAAEPRSESLASRTLRTTGTTPDKVARTIALVVDDLGLSFESTFYVRRAIHKYIATQIEPGDLVAIIRTAGGVGALSQFTTDKRLLHVAADGLRWDFRSRHGVGAFVSASENVPSGLEGDDLDDLHDSISSVGSMAAVEYIARGVSLLPGRKCIVYFSEGFASFFEDRMGSGDSRTSGSERIWKAMARMLSRVNAAGVVIYTVDARGLQTGGLNAEDNPVTRDWGFAGGGRLRPWLRRAIAAAGGRSPRSGPCLRLILRADVERLLERLAPAADGDVEIVTGQIGHQLSVAIRHDRIDGDEMRGRTKDGRILGADFMLRRQRGAGDEQGAEKAEATSHTTLPSSGVADRTLTGRCFRHMASRALVRGTV